jgi:hypothetical protein
VTILVVRTKQSELVAWMYVVMVDVIVRRLCEVPRDSLEVVMAVGIMVAAAVLAVVALDD